MSSSTKRTIGVLAREAGIPVSTLRYYEREGLIRPSERSDGNYRLYGPADLDRLRFIRAAQAVGFTIIDIKTLLEYRDGVIAPCKEVSVLIEERLEHIRQRMKEFRHIQRVLDSYLTECHQARQNADCHVLGKLDPAKPPPARGKRARRPKKSSSRS